MARWAERTAADVAGIPLWLLLLRLLLATLLVVALAGPVLNPEPELSGNGPLVLVVDDGWAAAPNWEERLAALEHAGFTVRRHVMVDILPYPHILYVCVRRP